MIIPWTSDKRTDEPRAQGRRWAAGDEGAKGLKDWGMEGLGNERRAAEVTSRECNVGVGGEPSPSLDGGALPRTKSSTAKELWHTPRLRRIQTSRSRRFALNFVLLSTVAWGGGCTYSGGELLFLLGLGRGEKVNARFHLSDGPILILIDDPAERVDVPMTTRELFDDLSQKLLRHKAAKKIIPQQTIDQLRQSVPEFERRGCREVGELAGAEQVLWIEVRDFLAEAQVSEADVAAYFSVSVKIINAKERTHRSEVRLWPVSPQGELVTVSMTGSEVAIAGSKGEVARELSRRLADRVARLFYDHRLGEFERTG